MTETQYKAQKVDEDNEVQEVKVYMNRADRISINGVKFRVTRVGRKKITMEIEGQGSFIVEGKPVNGGENVQ